MKGALSQNEIAAVCASAARGAGHQWGIAEEAGAAARVLAASGEFVPATFADILEQRAKLSAPVSRECLSPREGFAAQCPFQLGALLCDDAETYAGGKIQAIPAVASPLLVAACLSSAARALNRSFSLASEIARITATPSSVITFGKPESVHAKFVPMVSVYASRGIKRIKFTPSAIAITDPGWRRLMALSKKTMVPATPQSQSRGAGAGLTDND